MREGRRASPLGMSPRRLAAYFAVSIVFWSLALGPGGGGTSEVGVEASGALFNLALLILLFRGTEWALFLLAGEAALLTGVIASGGLPPSGPWFGALSVLTFVQFSLLCSLWASRRVNGARVGVEKWEE